MGNSTKEIKRYKNADLAEFDALINEKIEKAQEQLEYYLSQIKESGSNEDAKLKGLEDGSSSMENEKVYTMASRQRKLIQHLENAKLRIKNKVYGICRESGELISKERLRAVPHATLSIKAKEGRRKF